METYRKYIIWDKISDVYTPSGAKFTAEQWIAKHPIAGITKTVLAGGELNGAYFGIFSTMVERAKKHGCDFAGCETDQDYLDAIEAFEAEMNKPTGESSAEERIAAALEYQILMGMMNEEA